MVGGDASRVTNSYNLGEDHRNARRVASYSSQHDLSKVVCWIK